MAWPVSSNPSSRQFILPEVKDRKTGGAGIMYVDKGNRYAYSFFAFVQEAIWYNTELMKPEEVRAYDDLLHPKWKGKIGYSDPRAGGAGQGNWTFLFKTKGEEFLKKLVQQNLVIMREERPLAELLVKGSVAITIGLDIDNFGPFVKAGLPIKPLPQLKDGTYRNRVWNFGGHQEFSASQREQTLCQLAAEPGRPGNLPESAGRTDATSGCRFSERAVRRATGAEFMTLSSTISSRATQKRKQESIRKPALAAAQRLLN